MKNGDFGPLLVSFLEQETGVISRFILAIFNLAYCFYYLFAKSKSP